MTRVPTAAEHADVTAERDRVAWNLPRQPGRARSDALPGNAPSSQTVVAAPEIESVDAGAPLPPVVDSRNGPGVARSPFGLLF